MGQDNFSEETPAVLFCKRPPPISNHLVFTFCCKSKYRCMWSCSNTCMTKMVLRHVHKRLPGCQVASPKGDDKVGKCAAYKN